MARHRRGFYADRACSIRSDATRRSWGYTYRWLQRLHPATAVGGFTTDDLVAFVTQRGWGGPRWASATARNYRVALQSLFGWAHHSDRIPNDPAWRLGQLVRICRVGSGNPTGSPNPRSPPSSGRPTATTSAPNVTGPC